MGTFDILSIKGRKNDFAKILDDALKMSNQDRVDGEAGQLMSNWYESNNPEEVDLLYLAAALLTKLKHIEENIEEK